MEYDKRPWGEYWVLEDEKTHKVKRIKVNSQGRMSYQYHNYRAEAWTIVSGRARIVIDGVEKDYGAGETIIIPLGAKHRIGNPFDEPMIFIEVQHGTYFGEDDIIRLEDDYQRK